MGAPVLAVEKLKIESNPFVPGAGGGRMGRPLQTTFGEVVRQIGLETPVVVVSGSAGTGKTLLANMVTRACAEMGLTIRRIHRGDLVDGAAGERSDLLLIDEADSMTDLALKTLLLGSAKRPATTTVLLCLPSSVRRFSSAVDTVIVELTRLSQSDTRLYLVERATHAGLTDLFAPAALDLIVDASRGLPRSLWSIAGLAYFSAASAGAVQISRQHVADALASQITRPEPAEPPVPAAPSVKLFPEAAIKAPVAAPVAEPPRENANVAYLAAPSSTPPLTNRQPIAEVPVPVVALAPHSETSAAVALPVPVPGLAGVDSKEPQRERAAEAADAPYFLPAFDAALPSDGKQAADAPPVSPEIQEIAAGPIASFDSASAAEGEKPVSPLDAPSLNLLRDTAANDARKGHRSVVVLGVAASLAAVVVIPAMLLFGKFPGTTNAASAPVATLSIPTQAIPRQASVT
ncbi:MAG TPA: hypothetical protein VGM72_00100, partial [Micropepsaceae bacterium]